MGIRGRKPDHPAPGTIERDLWDARREWGSEWYWPPSWVRDLPAWARAMQEIAGWCDERLPRRLVNAWLAGKPAPHNSYAPLPTRRLATGQMREAIEPLVGQGPVFVMD